MLENFMTAELGLPVAIALISASTGFVLRGGSARKTRTLQRENHRLKSVVADMMIDRACTKDAR